MRTNFWLLLSLLWLFPALSMAQPSPFTIPDLPWTRDVGAKTMPEGDRQFRVNDFGARGDSVTLDTRAIQAAINACFAQGGGVVTFAPGKYLTGSIYVLSNVRLQIDKGVKILGSQNLEDYPMIFTRVAGIEMQWPSALINVLNQENVALTGDGLIDGQGNPFWSKYGSMSMDYVRKGLRWIVDYDCTRPRLMLISGSNNVTVKGLNMQRPGFWTLHILYSQYVTVDGVTIRNNIGGRGPSTDGIDIDSSSKILVQNSDIDCNDDNFCLKAGRDWDGLRVNRPCEYIVIRDCISRAGGGLFTCGSETSGGIRNVLAYNIKAYGTTVCLRFKSALTRGGTVENIYLRDIEMNNVGTAVEATCNWNPSYSYTTMPQGYTWESMPQHWRVMLTPPNPASQGIPHFRNIYVQNITGSARTGISAAGVEQTLLENFHFSNMKIQTSNAGSIKYAKGWNSNGLVFTNPSGAPVALRVDEATTSGMNLH